jgi:integrase
LLDRANLPRMRFHDLRHSCASLLLAQRVPARVVMETLGHSRISVTLDTYTHVMPALQRDAADAIDRVLGGEQER